MLEETKHKRPSISLAGRVYGELVYWGTIVGSVISIIGSFVNFITKKNYIDPAYLLSAIWEGKSVKEIWVKAVGSLPNGHWYLKYIFAGDGLSMLGISFGVFMVIPAIFAASVFLFKEKKPIFAVLAIIAGIITTLSMLGILKI